jgi:hypothetical protein
MLNYMPPFLSRFGLLGGLVAAAGGVYAHEPLWGETAQTFSHGVMHPEIRGGFLSTRGLFQGSKRIANPEGMKSEHSEVHVSMQYAPSTRLNVKLEVPFMQGRAEAMVGKERKTSRWSGTGNAMIFLKSRVLEQLRETSKTMHSAIVGIQLPTGERVAHEPNGEKMAPSEQPGTGNFGLQLGYALSFERLEDTVWLSASYLTELTGTVRRGDKLSLDAAYGYWVKRAYRPSDLGIVVAVGPRMEITGRDRGGDFRNTGYTLTAAQMTIMATQGLSQYRIGVQVPLSQRYRGTQMGRGLEFRIGWETFF